MSQWGSRRDFPDLIIAARFVLPQNGQLAILIGYD
jgi:hypothetical protein